MSTIARSLLSPVRKILRKARSIVSPTAPDRLQTFIGMTSLEERRYYANAMKQVGGLSGAVVDLGCWMGSTALSLADGLDPASDTTKILALDLFTWDPWMDDYAAELWCEYRPGESFLPEARGRVRAKRNVIEMQQADLTTYQWSKGDIKLLLVDAMKTWGLCQSIARNFYPSLVPGSLLIHQDYQCYDTAWIPLLHYRMRDTFRYAHGVRRGCTVAFETLRTPLLAEVVEATRSDNVTPEEFQAAIEFSATLLGTHGRAAMAASHVYYLADHGHRQLAQTLARQYEKEGVPHHGGFGVALEHCQQA